MDAKLRRYLQRVADTLADLDGDDDWLTVDLDRLYTWGVDPDLSVDENAERILGESVQPHHIGQRVATQKSARSTKASARKKKSAPYTSESLAVTRRLMAPGPFLEERAIINDLIWRYGHLQGTLRYVDRSEGEAIAKESHKLRDEAWRRIQELPEGDLRTNLTRELENPRR
jgi:hypothetical protein